MIISDADKVGFMDNKILEELCFAQPIKLDIPDYAIVFEGAGPIFKGLQAAKKRGENVYFEIDGMRYYSSKVEDYHLDAPGIRFYSAIVTKEGANKALGEYFEKDRETQEYVEKFDIEHETKQQGDDGITM